MRCANGIVCLGAASRVLGHLAATMGKWEAAELGMALEVGRLGDLARRLGEGLTRRPSVIGFVQVERKSNDHP